MCLLNAKRKVRKCLILFVVRVCLNSWDSFYTRALIYVVHKAQDKKNRNRTEKGKAD